MVVGRPATDRGGMRRVKNGYGASALEQVGRREIAPPGNQISAINVSLLDGVCCTHILLTSPSRKGAIMAEPPGSNEWTSETFQLTVTEFVLEADLQEARPDPPEDPMPPKGRGPPPRSPTSPYGTK
jgi:hypothetical protein